MRNLKKILALVLALVMSLSLMATAGAADTAAAANSETVTAEYQTAKDVLEALGVFKGYEDGTFKPQQSITRAEVATILYRMVTGDVASARSDIYGDMSNTTFTDLAGANWARGYINYCANAKLIVGVGGNKFMPSANITGYATLAMVLRALGYDKNGEFQGQGWEIRTASTARELGILKNIKSENELSTPATREMVAELLFRAMLCEKVQYNALIQDYTKTGVTLGYEVFSLEEVTGVVMANEYGDIRRYENGTGYGSVLAADTTVLRGSDGKDRTVNYGSGLDDLGLTRRAYTIEDGNKVNKYLLQNLKLEDIDADEVTYDDGEELSSISSKISGDKAQYFVNYGENHDDIKTTIKISYQAKLIADTITARTEADAIAAFRTKYHLSTNVSVANGQLTYVKPSYPGSSYYRIVYQPKDNNDVVNGAGLRTENNHIYSVVTANNEIYYRVEVAPKTVLTAGDKEMINAIFKTANLNPQNTTELVVDGEVFKGTQSRYDYSDWNSYEEFLAECLDVITEAANTKITSNPLGYRLRIIDNNKDGVTDWVFQTRYTVTTVKSNTDGKIALDTDETSINAWGANDLEGKYPDSVNSLASNPTVANEGDDVAAGDVVLYAVIDGVARVWKAETAEVRVDAINRTTATVTTADGATYTESAVHEHTSQKELIDSGVANMAGKTAYTLYLDNYGNLAAFSQNLVGKLTLLTDGWADVQKNGTEYAVKAWDKDEQKFVQYDIPANGNWFINDQDSNNNWNRIRRFVPLNCEEVPVDDIHTIMAYVESDGENATLIPVDVVYDTQRLNANRDVRMIDMGKTIPTTGWSYGDIYNTTYRLQNNWSNGWNNDPNTNNGVYAEKGANVEVRALANTVYYYVYRTWYGSSYSMVVHQDTNNNWNKLRTDNNAAYVEDVYVVGTKATHVTTTGAPTQEYYTADAVVIELNDDFYANFQNDHEEIFVYDFENVVNSINLEKVHAINGKGEDVEFTIDLTRSDRIYTEGDGKGGEISNSMPAPGLFYVWRTDEAGDIWAISRMTHEQITNSGHYDVGTVAYSSFTFAQNYANIYNWYVNNADAHWGTHGGHRSDEASPMWTDGAYSANRIGVDASLYYTLRYDANNYGYGYDATLTKVDGATALSENANDIANGATNEVLVRYNSSNNNIVYAVSFGHFESTYTENFAQRVYRGVLQYKLNGTTGAYTVAVTNDGNGTAAASKTTANAGDTVTITATPNPGFVVDTITVNGTPITGTSFTMPAQNTTVHVTFKAGQAENTTLTVSWQIGALEPDPAFNRVTPNAVITMTGETRSIDLGDLSLPAGATVDPAQLELKDIIVKDNDGTITVDKANGKITRNAAFPANVTVIVQYGAKDTTGNENNPGTEWPTPSNPGGFGGGLMAPKAQTLSMEEDTKEFNWIVTAFASANIEPVQVTAPGNVSGAQDSNARTSLTLQWPMTYLGEQTNAQGQVLRGWRITGHLSKADYQRYVTTKALTIAFAAGPFSGATPTDPVTGTQPGVIYNKDLGTYTVYWYSENPDQVNPNLTWMLNELTAAKLGDKAIAGAKIKDGSVEKLWGTVAQPSVSIEGTSKTVNVSLIRVYKISAKDLNNKEMDAVYAKAGDANVVLTGITPGNYVRSDDDDGVTPNALGVGEANKVAVVLNNTRTISVDSVPTCDLTYVPAVQIHHDGSTGINSLVRKANGATVAALSWVAVGDTLVMSRNIAIGSADWPNLYFSFEANETKLDLRRAYDSELLSGTEKVTEDYLVNKADADENDRIVLWIKCGTKIYIDNQYKGLWAGGGSFAAAETSKEFTGVTDGANYIPIAPATTTKPNNTVYQRSSSKNVLTATVTKAPVTGAFVSATLTPQAGNTLLDYVQDGELYLVKASLVEGGNTLDTTVADHKVTAVYSYTNTVAGVSVENAPWLGTPTGEMIQGQKCYFPVDANLSIDYACANAGHATWFGNGVYDGAKIEMSQTILAESLTGSKAQARNQAVGAGGTINVYDRVAKVTLPQTATLSITGDPTVDTGDIYWDAGNNRPGLPSGTNIEGVAGSTAVTVTRVGSVTAGGFEKGKAYDTELVITPNNDIYFDANHLPEVLLSNKDVTDAAGVVLGHLTIKNDVTHVNEDGKLVVIVTLTMEP